MHAINGHLSHLQDFGAEALSGSSVESCAHASPKPASFLGLPRELRDIIYLLCMPRRNIHIQYSGPSYSGGSLCAPSFNQSSGFTRNLCTVEGTTEDDATKTSKWTDGAAGHYPDYKTRHQGCSYESIRSGKQQEPEPVWPFALLFVCKQTHDELLGEIYRRNAFSFSHQDYLHTFATKISAKYVSLIRDLRLAVYMGSLRDGLFHQHPEKLLAVCRAFSGVRKLHATLELAFWKMPQARDTLKTDWKIAHWARGLLNFARLPLEHVSVYVYDSVDNHFRDERQSTIINHLLDDPERRRWAAAIRDQLLAPWDREAVLASLHSRRAQEEQYHKKLCYGRVGSFGESCPLLSPEERIP